VRAVRLIPIGARRSGAAVVVLLAVAGAAGLGAALAANGPEAGSSAPAAVRAAGAGVSSGRAGARADPASHAAPVRARRPAIVQKPIPYGAKRRAEMAAYARRHYGIAGSHLVPKVIVQHYTASTTFASAFATFAADVPDPELHELPGTCAHFIVDSDGTIYQLVPLTIMCRHTVGLNGVAIGIEHVGTSDRQILSNRHQIAASLALTLWLMQRHRIGLGDVIGHNESLTSRYRKELYRSWRCQTHGDWTKASMDVYRAHLRALAKPNGVPIGGPVRRVRPSC
jgi:N-acetylmuramoyl-L-alanine amidase